MNTRSRPGAGTHVPVLLHEVIAAIAPRDGGLYVDGTFGGGGYSGGFLAASGCRVVGLDRDPDAIDRGRSLADRLPGRLTLIEGRFGDMADLLTSRGLTPVDGVALDLGVSSMQIDDADRGFSFQADGALDMRMGRTGLSAADVVNTWSEADLCRVIRDLGEERLARRIARAIVAERNTTPITRTGQLAAVVRKVVPRANDGIDPATRTFQALRMLVNDELGELDRGLAGAESVLKPGGRLAVVAFHSLEDRAVKGFLRTRSGELPRGSRHLPDAPAGRAPTFRLLTRRAVRPGPLETGANPRARSARLRVAERTSAPAWPGETPS